MEIIGSRGRVEIFGRRETAEERTLSFNTYAQLGCERKKKKIQEGKGGEGAKLIRGGESSGREERKREDERASSISPTW